MSKHSTANIECRSTLLFPPYCFHSTVSTLLFPLCPRSHSVQNHILESFGRPLTHVGSSEEAVPVPRDEKVNRVPDDSWHDFLDLRKVAVGRLQMLTRASQAVELLLFFIFCFSGGIFFFSGGIFVQVAFRLFIKLVLRQPLHYMPDSKLCYHLNQMCVKFKPDEAFCSNAKSKYYLRQTIVPQTNQYLLQTNNSYKP